MDQLLRRFRQLRGDLVAWMGKLSQRERVMVSGAAVAVFVFVTSLTSLSISNGLAQREARIERKTRFLTEVSKLAVGYRERQAERQALEQRLKGPPIQLLSFISQQGAQQQIEVGDLRPAPVADPPQGLREDAVEVNIARVELSKLARFLQALERGQGVVRVRRLRLNTRSDDPRQVDATFTVSAYGLKS
jgi:general secretion pathway protein M